jgi:exonuclease III
MDSAELSIMSWNVRGLNDAAHRELVKQTADSARPVIVCLQETKIDSMMPSIILETLGHRLASYQALDAEGTRGGVLLAWDKDVALVTDIDMRSFSISATVTVLMSNSRFRISTCYGPANDARKEDFLQEMLMLKPAAGVPWLIVGDFNLIYKASDKNNLNLNRRLMGKFRAALDDCELLEICLHNRRFTWSNERERPTLVRLDRAFCNADWELTFSNYALNAFVNRGFRSLPDHPNTSSPIAAEGLLQI